MTPLQFETEYSPAWDRLQALLDQLEGPAPKKRRSWCDGRSARSRAEPLAAAELTRLYRRSCEHLALARARDYPIHLVERLEALTHRAHQVIYRRHDYGLARLKRLLLVDFPCAVRAQRRYLLVAALVFVLPTLLLGFATWRDPGVVLTVVDAEHARNFDQMYDDGAKALGRQRDAGTDWQMFGFYIMNNIGVAFRCFAGGVLAGVGSLFFLAYNGFLGGAVGGYVAARGHALNFFSFVVTHTAFEITAIVIAGAAGLRLGSALVAPGRQTRLQALQARSREAIVLVYGVIAMLLVAAALEAFWSSARWVAPAVKFGVGAACWALVIAYLGWQGRPRQG
jgi:uncharacterized membrane protein SpoIIM required for sporulation